MWDANLSLETVLEDLENLPPGVSREQKQVLLFVERDSPLAVVDLILGFPEADTLYLGLLLIDEHQHRQGYGSRIYRAIEEDMISLGYVRGRLGVLENNEKALCFWEKMGYQKVKKMVSTVHPEKKWSAYVMEKLF